MASLDFVIDILEKIETQKIDYYLITVQEEKGGDYKADVFFNFNNATSAESALAVSKDVEDGIRKKYGISSNNKASTKKSKKASKPSKPSDKKKK